MEGFVLRQGSVLPIAHGIVGADQIDHQMFDADLLVCQAAQIERFDGPEHAQAVFAAGDDLHFAAVGQDLA